MKFTTILSEETCLTQDDDKLQIYHSCPKNYRRFLVQFIGVEKHDELASSKKTFHGIYKLLAMVQAPLH